MNKEKMPFFDQIKVADIMVALDDLTYKLLYCTKFMELSMKYVNSNTLSFITIFCAIFLTLFNHTIFRSSCVNLNKQHCNNSVPAVNEILSLVRKCHSCNVNYDDTLIIIDGDVANDSE